MKISDTIRYWNVITGIVLASFFLIPSSSLSADNLNEGRTFFVNQSWDELSRTAVAATLREISDRAYFYVEDRYWATLSQPQQNIFSNYLKDLGREFDQVIYPKETQFWGAEPNPGIDGEPKVTILLHDLTRGIGGYFETGNLYSKNISPTSNEREMVVVAVEAVGVSAKLFLAHEFQHLISFNQKDLLNKASEDVWLNELRAEYANSVVGYNDTFQNSNLDRRLSAFVKDPNDSLTEWPNVPDDYAHAALFAEYLAEQFGLAIISETIKMSSVGIASIDQYLQSIGRPERFSDIFANWLVALYKNDVSVDARHGYQRSELRNFRVSPRQLFVSYPGIIELSQDLKPWEGSWHQINLSGLPEGKAVKIDFNAEAGFKLWYVDNFGNMAALPDNGAIINKGGLGHVVLLPVNESKRSSFGSNEESRTFRAVVELTDPPKPALKNGDLIKRPHEPETYVIEGKYKRYLRPEVIALYGHLDPAKVTAVDDEIFHSFTTANYVRNVNQEQVYAVWPDGTKHWLKITPQQWDASGRDWGAIFIINDLELNYYQTGENIIR